MLTKLLRHGHSQAVIIPALFLRKLSIKKGDHIDLRFDYGQAKVTLSFPDARQLRLEVGQNRKRKNA